MRKVLEWELITVGVSQDGDLSVGLEVEVIGIYINGI